MVLVTLLAATLGLTTLTTASRAETATFSDRLTVKRPTRAFSLSTGAGTLEATLAFSGRAPSVTLSVLGPGGAPLAETTSATSPMSLRSPVSEGVHQIQVRGNGSWTGATSFSLSLNYPDPTITTTTTTTTTTTPPSVYVVPASITADCSRPVDAEIIAWINSVPDNATLRFAPGACYGQDDTITVRDRIGLVIDGSGATFRALTPGHSHRTNWRLEAGANLTLKNMTVRGANPDAGITPLAYIAAKEWQHGYSIDATQGATLDNVAAYDVYGDMVGAQYDERVGPYVSMPVRNLVVRNSRFERNGRQGIGLSHVENFLLENSYLGNINMNAIDLELNEPEEHGVDVKILNNTFGPTRFSVLANVGSGWDPNVGKVTVEGNRQEGPLISCRPPVYVESPTGYYRYDYSVKNNDLIAYGDAFDFKGAKNVVVSGNVVRFSNGECGTLAGVGLIDSHNVSVTNNQFIGAETAVKKDGASTDVTESGNTL